MCSPENVTFLFYKRSPNAPETRERELVPLRKIRDSYEKRVIALILCGEDT